MTRRNFPGMVRGCSKCGDEITVTEQMCKQRTYRCRSCHQATAQTTTAICSIPGCGRPHRALGWCHGHRYRWVRYGDPLGGKPINARGTGNGEVQRYFREVVLPYEGTECLIWPFGCCPRGYGRLKYEGRQIIASRLICEIVNGPPLTPELQAAHSCGKGHLGCVNPGHLSWKTPAANQADRIIHGTYGRRRAAIGISQEGEDDRG